MKNLLTFVIGVAVGTVAGVLATKKHYKDEFQKYCEMKSAEETAKELAKRVSDKIKTEIDETEAAEENTEPASKEEDGSESNDTDESADEDEDEDWLREPEIHITRDPFDVEDDDWLTEEEKELIEAEREFQKEIEEYIGTRIPYNITKHMYDTPYNYFTKSILVINEKEDRAYDANTGEELEDWHEVIGDRDYGTLDEDKKDEFGVIYIRCENISTDYEITYSKFDWVG